MFESIAITITNRARDIVSALGIATRKTPWLAPVAILALFLVL